MQGTLAYNIIVGLIDYAQGNLLIDTCVKMLIILNPNISYKYTKFGRGVDHIDCKNTVYNEKQS